MVREGRALPAIDWCRQKARETDSPVLKEKLGDLMVLNKRFAEAGENYRAVIEEARTAETAIRVGARWSRILRVLGEQEEALALEQRLRERWKDHPVVPWLEKSRP
jgi:hypothetical protein